MGNHGKALAKFGMGSIKRMWDLTCLYWSLRPMRNFLILGLSSLSLSNPQVDVAGTLATITMWYFTIGINFPPGYLKLGVERRNGISTLIENNKVL